MDNLIYIVAGLVSAIGLIIVIQALFLLLQVKELLQGAGGALVNRFEVAEGRVSALPASVLTTLRGASEFVASHIDEPSDAAIIAATLQANKIRAQLLQLEILHKVLPVTDRELTEEDMARAGALVGKVTKELFDGIPLTEKGGAVSFFEGLGLPPDIASKG